MATPTEDTSTELRLAAVAPSKSHSASESASLVLHLFDELQARLARYILAFGLPLHDAEDIVQETFLSLFHHLERDRPRWNLNAWLFRVAHNLALKRRTSNRISSRDLDHEALLARHPDPSHNAEEQLSFDQTQRRLRAVFAALPEQDQRCLHLRSEGLKYREIAKVLGISLGSVSASLSRSLERMSRVAGGE